MTQNLYIFSFSFHTNIISIAIWHHTANQISQLLTTVNKIALQIFNFTQFCIKTFHILLFFEFQGLGFNITKQHVMYGCNSKSSVLHHVLGTTRLLLHYGNYSEMHKRYSTWNTSIKIQNSLCKELKRELKRSHIQSFHNYFGTEQSYFFHTIYLGL